MTLEQNLKYAEYGLLKCQEKFTLGGLNIRKNFDELSRKRRQILIEQLCVIRRYDQLCALEIVNDKLTAEEQIEKEKMFSRLKGGLCVALAVYTRKVILQKYPDIAVEYVQTNDHQFLVIGRSKESQRQDVTTWGDMAVICDPWAGISYPASKFPEYQAGPSIDYYNMDRDDKPYPCDDHYLMGSLTAVEPELYSADILLNAGAQKAVEKNFVPALRLLERARVIYGKMSYAKIAYAQCNTNMASCYIGLKEYDKALAANEIVFGIYEIEYGLDHERTKKAEHMRAQLKILVNSVVSNSRRLLLINGSKPANKKDAEKIYIAAVVSFNNQDYQSTITGVENALAEFDKLADCELNRATCYSTLASCHRELGDFSKAKEMAEAAVKIFEAKLGSENEKTINAKTKLAGIEEKQNKRRLG